jgi:outer membrane immunogenic protein
MRNVLLAAVAAGAGLCALPALAQDAPAERGEFDGVYVGGSIGYDAQPNDVGERILFDRGLNGSFGDTVTTAAGANAFSPGFCNGRARAATAAQGCRNDKDNKAYYVRAGFDAQFGGVVTGAVAEFGRTEIRDSVTGFSTTPASYTMTRRIDWEGSVRGRLGYAFDRTLFYGAVGPGYAQVKNRFTTTNTANAFASGGNKKQLGYLAGGGVEQKLAANLSLGLEYMYHSYQDNDARVVVTQGSAPTTNPFVLAPNTSGTAFRRSDSDFNWHSARAVVAFRF